MIISFFGHSDFRENEEIKKRLLLILKEEAQGENTLLFLGGYGAFDDFARRCAREHQEKENPACTLIFVTPYLDNSKKGGAALYDEILYPPLEQIPLRYAISHRNRYMAERADLVIAFVERRFGGAYQALATARRLKKRIVNLAEEG